MIDEDMPICTQDASSFFRCPPSHPPGRVGDERDIIASVSVRMGASGRHRSPVPPPQPVPPPGKIIPMSQKREDSYLIRQTDSAPLQRGFD